MVFSFNDMLIDNEEKMIEEKEKLTQTIDKQNQKTEVSQIDS